MKNAQTVTNEFSDNLSTSKPMPNKIESIRGEKFYNLLVKNFLKVKNLLQFSRFFDKSPSLTEKVIRTMRYLPKNQFF